MGFLYISLFISIINAADLNPNFRIDCTAVCDQDNQNYSEFVCDICHANKRILQSCSVTQKFYTSINNTHEQDLRDGINSYCSDSSISGMDDYFILTDSFPDYDLIHHEDCWEYESNTVIGDCSTTEEPYFYGWGMILGSKNDHAKNISLHVNHPLHDLNTVQISSYIYETIQPKWMLIAGAHRYSWVDSSELPPNCSSQTIPVCGINYGADVAREVDECNELPYTTAFQIFHEEISSNSLCTDASDELFSLSIHGFDNDEVDLANRPSFILTNGNDSENHCNPPDPVTSTIYHDLKNYFSNHDLYNTVCEDNGVVAVIVQQELSCALQPESCGDSLNPYSLYSGYSNPQGRYTNNTDQLNTNTENDIWMQIEIDKCIRDNFNLYVEAAQVISDAIINCTSGECSECDANTPCSTDFSQGGNGVDYGMFNYDCSCLEGVAINGSCANYGDVNLDSLVDILDINLIVNYIIQVTIPTVQELILADFNQDGEVNVVDLVIMVQDIFNQ